MQILLAARDTVAKAGLGAQLQKGMQLGNGAWCSLLPLQMVRG